MDPTANLGSIPPSSSTTAGQNPLLQKNRFSWKNTLKAAAIVLKKTSTPTSSESPKPAVLTDQSSDDSVSVLKSLLPPTHSVSLVQTTPNPRLGTRNEIEILAMLVSAKAHDPDKFKHVVCPVDIAVNTNAENVIQFEPLIELQVVDLALLETAELSFQLMSGLNAIHSLSICHFDIKPSNLMMNQRGFLIIIDFALARVCDGSVHPPGRGTRGYIAPELYPPRVCYSTSPDIYSAGIVIGLMVEPYLSHLNLRILGGSNSFPVHIDQVWSDLREFVEIDALSNDDIFPPILQLMADFLLRLLTTSTSSSPASNHRYLRLTASQALNHPYLTILHNRDLAFKEFKYLTPNEWRLRRAGDQLRARQRRHGFDMFRFAG